jgi:2'-hydroxyisoflavone reductase
VEEVTGATYGGLKVLCERTAHARFGGDTFIVRPTYVIGPDDYTWRFPYWVARIARGGTVLAPGPADDPAQYIDGRDMANWIVDMVGRGEGGTFHAAGPSVGFTWGEELRTIADAVGPADTELAWVDEGFLVEQGLDGAALPLWSGGDEGRWVMAVDPAAAFASGLHMRPLAETVRDTLAWAAEHTQPATPGLSADRERELLDTWGARQRARQGVTE